MPNNITFLLLLSTFAVCLSGCGVYGFGAGNIPSFAYMEGKAFRHGDIEDTLTELIKRAGGGFALASLLSKGSKFNGLDIKRVYFGNWLRDYSQAMDIATLKKIPQQTIINLLMVLGFMAHGYVTHEFEITPERLGVYLPVEHIDNPKGYGDGEDARRYHPALRPPVDPRELEIDPRTGLKNYIANEQGHWDTSRSLVRRLLEQCIHLGRQHRSQGRKQDEYEAYRLLGTALHTLEDFSAHSNFCELALVMMGHTDVFLHVGDQVRIQAPNGKWVAPVVTGTFGSHDFFHSLLGEAGDHISQVGPLLPLEPYSSRNQTSVTDVNKELDRARFQAQSQTRSGPGNLSGPGDVLRSLFSSLPGGVGMEMSREVEAMEKMRSSGTSAGGKKPEEMSPQELHAVLWGVLTWRDSVMKKIEKTIEKIPGLGSLIGSIGDSIAVLVLTTIDPFLRPILQTTTTQLHAVSGEVINTHDQYEVFNDPRASDPTHSFLSKDHFGLVLNEPAGLVAKVVVTNTVTLIVKAWDDPSVSVRNTVEEILECLFHPDFHNPHSKVQRDMLQCINEWVGKLGPQQHQIIQRLSKSAVRNHDNVRPVGDREIRATPLAQPNFGQENIGPMRGGLSGPPVIPGNRPSFPQDAYTYGYGGAPPPPIGGQAVYHSEVMVEQSATPYAPPSQFYPPSSGLLQPSSLPHSSTYGPTSPDSSYVPVSYSRQHPHLGYAPSYESPPSRSFPGGPVPDFPTGSIPEYSGPVPSSFTPEGVAPSLSFVGLEPSFPGEPAPSFPSGPASAFTDSGTDYHSHGQQRHEHDYRYDHGHHQSGYPGAERW